MNESLVVPDSSVVLKWFLQDEILSDKALQIRDSYLAGDISLFAPALLAYELANVLHFKGSLKTEEVQLAVRSLFDIGIVWVQPDALSLLRAVELARSFKLTVYDAAFVVVAEQEDAVFITADSRLAQQLIVLPFVRLLGNVESK